MYQNKTMSEYFEDKRRLRNVRDQVFLVTVNLIQFSSRSENNSCKIYNWIL